ncbi:MAG: L-rhamnose isomerase [candidate division KSB1 bacterium]|nr:L-rhamnose isomerase [candidate division KSB1 bacterium]MDZ7276240.1 L-rhamnose isomerase [candidate division KSB1 bacterium]MDZ7287954.1 L-rhamnose isomerase [candidate division KSB1 bacterium]MDZ7300033.1 L-rhamnose isomerase [candidate division KSB1 bacterium]MDZ7308423.1 L-rhamnose isomerase [candidate division KSB1 bacterium]
MNSSLISKAYDLARERYAEFGVDTEAALAQLQQLSISLQCWQGDDVAGFERAGAALADGGIQVTGNYPGRARTADELRADAEQAFALIPGRHRFNLHAMYGEFGGRQVDRDAISIEHFQGWIDWAASRQLQLDFNATCFSHPLAAGGFTLSHPDQAVRAFWIEHVQRCRAISAGIGRRLGSPCLHNLWIPDGMKDLPADRWRPRARLRESLDAIFQTAYSPGEMKDALEGKLFGLGSEAYVVGSHEFYLGYALRHGKIICLDLGHFHPTEVVADKLSALLQFFPELLLHVSRGVRWDSDHVVILNDEVRAVAEEIVRGQALTRVHLALDFFDASIHRVAAWVIGTRATLKALLLALLEPREQLCQLEAAGDYSGRLALLEETKTLPFGAVWDHYCLRMNVPPGMAWLQELKQYEKEVTSRRE